MDVEDEKRPAVAVMQHFGCRLPLNFVAEEEEKLLGEGRGLVCMTGLPRFCPISCPVLQEPDAARSTVACVVIISLEKEKKTLHWDS